MTQKQIAVVVSGFPRRSETFAINELLALEERGALAAIFATKPGDGSNLQPGHERLLPLLRVLPNGTPVEQGASVAAFLSGRNEHQAGRFHRDIRSLTACCSHSSTRASGMPIPT